MRRKLFLSSLLVCAVTSAMAAYVPMAVSSGFNADVIANGVGTSIATTNNDVDGVSYSFAATGWQFNTTSTPVANALPANGVIASPVTPGLTYQLAGYSANNCLRINNATAGTLTFASQIKAQNVYVLATSGSGNCTITAQINFTDATNQQVTGLAVNDWFGGTPYEIGQIGRILRNTTSATLETSTDGPRLYRLLLAVAAANQNKQIASIQFTRTAGAGVLNVFAVSFETCAAPTAPSATAITATTATLNWTQTSMPGQWQIKYGAPGFNPVTAGTSVFTATKPYVLNPPLTPTTAYSYYVRAVCGPNDTSVWSQVTNFTSSCIVPTIAAQADSYRCGPGTVVLQAAASAGGSIKWYSALTGGTALATGNSFTTPSITTATTYYIAAASGTCESTPRQAVIASVRPVPAVNIGNDTTICPGVTYTLDAGNPGASYTWNIGATTRSVTAGGPGSYTVQVMLNGCSNTDTRVITPGIVPQNNLAAASDLCAGNTTTLDAGNGGSSFLWTPGGATTQTINVTTGGTKSVIIKSTTGCMITSSTNITLRPLPVVDLGNDTSICNGDQITLDAGNPSDTYLWSPGGATTQTIVASDSGTYAVTVTTPFNCKSTDAKHVAYLPALHVAGFNFIPLFYEDLGKVKFEALNPVSVTRYLWDFGDAGATSTLASPTHTYAAAGAYTVTLKVSNDCGVYETSLPIHIDLVTGIVTLDKEAADVVIYPNPSRDVLTIDNRSANLKFREVIIVNTLGAIVYKGSMIGNHQQVQVRGLASGVYYMRILTDKGFVIRKFEVLK